MGGKIMTRLRLTVYGLVLLALAGCSDRRASQTATQEPGALTSTPARTTGSATNGAVAQANATISVDGLLFVGADTAKVGYTLKVSLKNDESVPVDVTIIDPAGQTAAQAQLTGGATGEISTTANAPGKWTVKFHDPSGDLTKVITVT
jgi:hypothetical protein